MAQHPPSDAAALIGLFAMMLLIAGAAADTPSGANCGNLGEDYYSFSRANPYVVGGTHTLDTFFLDASACVAGNVNGDPSFRVDGGSDSAGGACIVNNASAVRALYGAGQTVTVVFGNGPAASCSCSADIPLDANVVGGTLTIKAEATGFIDGTAYPFACALEFKVRATDKPLEDGDTFAFTYIAVEANADGSSPTPVMWHAVFWALGGVAVVCFVVVGACYMRRLRQRRHQALLLGGGYTFVPPAPGVASPTGRSPTGVVVSIAPPLHSSPSGHQPPKAGKYGTA